MEIRAIRGLLAHRAAQAFNRATVPLRHWYYVGGGHTRLAGALPARLGCLLGLEDGAAVGTRRIEIGPGPHPTPGYLHMDISPLEPHLEAIGPMWDLPFPDHWASEIRAIQCLEHVHPSRLEDTLREWHRVLAPGGRVLISVPNGPAIMEAFARAPVPEKWALLGSVLGMYCGPAIRDPRELTVRSDHQIIFDWPMLAWALESTGFRELEDLSRVWRDRHSEAWGPVVETYSLVARATAA